MQPQDQTPPPPDQTDSAVPNGPAAAAPPPAPETGAPVPPQTPPPPADLLAQAQLSAPPAGSRNKMMLIMAGGLIVLVIAASIALSVLGHKAAPKAAPQANTQNNSSSQPNNSVIGGEQQKARNSKRQSDLASLQTQLEAFFSQNGYYPSLTDMNNSAWRAANMKSLDQNALIDPSNPTGSTTLAAAPAAKQYAYQVTDASGKSCENDDTKCAKYTLTATYEGTVGGTSTLTRNNLD